MYDLGKLFTTRLLFSDNAGSPLGRIRMVGTVAHSTGVDRRRLDSYAIVIAVAGAGFYSDERGFERTIEPGDTLTLFPGLLHSYGPGRDQIWDELYAVFDGPAFELLEHVGVLQRSRPVIMLRPFEPFVSDLTELASAARPANERGRAMGVCSLLSLLIAMFVQGDQAPRWLERACLRLGQDLDGEIDLAAVARNAGMSYESFRKRFKLATGSAPVEYRNHKRLETARQLLRSTSLTIREIAASLGYYDEYHFSRRFRKATGSAPGAYRRRALRT